MLGWLSAATTRASRSKRASACGFSARRSGSTLTATSRCSRVSRARYTSPIPPAPIGDEHFIGSEPRAGSKGHSSRRDYRACRSDPPRQGCGERLTPTLHDGTNRALFKVNAGSRLGPDGSRTAGQSCRGPSNAHPAFAGFPFHHRGRRGAGRAADSDRLVARLHPVARAPQPSRHRDLVAVLGGDRRLGTQRPGRLGLGHHQLRVLDRHRACRHAHLRDPVPLPAEVAHLDQPRGGGDDHLRRHVRDDVPGDPRRPRLGRLLDVPASEPDGHVAQLQVPAALGRVRR